jgi:hypothetical protein
LVQSYDSFPERFISIQISRFIIEHLTLYVPMTALRDLRRSSCKCRGTATAGLGAILKYLRTATKRWRGYAVHYFTFQERASEYQNQYQNQFLNFPLGKGWRLVFRGQKDLGLEKIAWAWKRDSLTIGKKILWL